MDSMDSAVTNGILPACSLFFHGDHNFHGYYLMCVFETCSSPLPGDELVQ